jgi:hypothetical protein
MPKTYKSPYLQPSGISLEEGPPKLINVKLHAPYALKLPLDTGSKAENYIWYL